ncbi:MAG: cobalamin-binding protein [Rubrobacter sp.]|nr:cobalamin-binding protein [Rubrobacter sp.]
MSDTPRCVVSLLPGATETVGFVGAAGSLVGVTHECDYPPGVERLPKLTASRIDHHALSSSEIDSAVGNLTDAGSIYTLDANLLEELAPDLIVTQGLCDVCAVSLDVVERAAADLSSEPRILSLNPGSLEEVLRDTETLGATLGRARETRREVEALRERISRVQRAVAGLPRPRVGCLEWLDPPFSAGHWVPEMVRLAGGEEVFAEAGEPSVRLSPEEVSAAAPEALVLMPCGFGLERALEETHLLADLPGWRQLPAVRDGRVWAVDANSYFSRPAPRLVEGVELLARLLHPGAFPEDPDARDARAVSGLTVR